MKKNIENIIKEYYSNDYQEDGRLTQDKVHHIEFLTTIKYIDKYLKKENRILEVGAGTGAYSLYYAKKGYRVDAVELVKSNVDIFKNNIKKDMDITVTQGNALDLSMYEDNTFDITLVLGPIYHLFKKQDIDKAIKEAIRVTKKGGIIYIAFILFDLTMLYWGFQDKNLFENFGEGKMISKDYMPNNKEEYIFNINHYSTVKEIMNKYNLNTMHYVATDGIGRIIKDTLNNFTEEEYNHYINYHLTICEREDLIGYSGHILYIGRKN